MSTPDDALTKGLAEPVDLDKVREVVTKLAGPPAVATVH